MPLVMKDDLHHHHHHQIHPQHHSQHHSQQQQQQQQQHIHDFKLPPTNGGKSAWTDTATGCLIDVFEEKWNSLRRGNLKAKNWDEVGIELGQRCGVPKTGEQCRHKIEKLRGKFRQEKVISNFSPSKWPWFDRLHKVFENRMLREVVDYETSEKAELRQAQQQHQETTYHHNHHNQHLNQGHNLHQQLHLQNKQLHERDSVHEIPLAVAAPPHQLELLDCRPHAEVADDKAVDDSSYSRKEVSSERDEEDEEEDDEGTPRSKSRGRGSRNGASRKRGREYPVPTEFISAMKTLGEVLLKIEESRIEHERLVLETEQRRAHMQEVELKREEMALKKTEMMMQHELKRTQMLLEIEMRKTNAQMEMFEALFKSRKHARQDDAAGPFDV